MIIILNFIESWKTLYLKYESWILCKTKLYTYKQIIILFNHIENLILHS